MQKKTCRFIIFALFFSYACNDITEISYNGQRNTPVFYISGLNADTDIENHQRFLNLLNDAVETLDCSFSALSDSATRSALIRAGSRGTRLRIAYDADKAALPEFKDFLAQAESLQSITLLPVAADSDSTGRAHYSDFCIADSQHIWLSTLEVQNHSQENRPGFTAFFRAEDDLLAREFTREIDLLANRLSGSRKTATDFNTRFSINGMTIGILWGPHEDPVAQMAEAVRAARYSVDLYTTGLQETSSDVLTDFTENLKAAVLKGIQVQVTASEAALFDSASTLPQLLASVELRVLPNRNAFNDTQILLIDKDTDYETVYIFSGALNARSDSTHNSYLFTVDHDYRDTVSENLFSDIKSISEQINTERHTLTDGDVSAGDVVITEINWAGSIDNETALHNHDEYIEIYNRSADVISLNSWQLGCSSLTSNTVISLPAGLTIAPGEYLVITSSGSESVKGDVLRNAADGGEKLSIPNSTRLCLLTDGDFNNSATEVSAPAFWQNKLDGRIIDSAGCFTTDPAQNSCPDLTDLSGYTAFNETENRFYSRFGLNRLETAVSGSGRRAMERIETGSPGTSPANWQSSRLSENENHHIQAEYRRYTFGSPGAANSAAPADTADIFITEIQYAGSYNNSGTSFTGDDFIELYNRGNAAVSVGGWTFVCTNSTTAGSFSEYFTIPYGTSIASESFTVITASDLYSLEGSLDGNDIIAPGFSLTTTLTGCLLLNGSDSITGLTGNDSADSDTVLNGHYDTAFLYGHIIDRIGDHSTSFSTAGLGYNSSDQRGSAFRLNLNGDGSSMAEWSAELLNESLNILLNTSYRNNTSASPGAYIPLIKTGRNLYFGTSTTHPNSRMKVSLLNALANNSASSAENITLTIKTDSDPTGFTTAFNETSTDSSEFSGEIYFATDGTADKADVAPGDNVRVTYSLNGKTYTASALWSDRHPVIAEAGINCGSDSSNDYIRISNPASTSLSLDDLQIQRDADCSIGSSDWSTTIPLSGSLAPGAILTIGDNNWSATTACPLPDVYSHNLVINSDDCINLSFKNSPIISETSEGVIDFLGYGSAAVSETSPAPDLDSGEKCIARDGLSLDSNDNSSDFSVSGGCLQ